jgi:hypothetical protein
MFRPTWPSSGVYDILLFIPATKATKTAKQIPSQTRTQEYGN